MSFKNKFYNRYVSTHITERKGQASLNTFRQKAIYFQQNWRKFFPKDKHSKIVDVGCGDGNLLWWLQQSGYLNTEGIDISPEQVAIARSMGVQNVCEAEIKSFLTEKVGVYNVIILRDVIEHFSRQEIIHLLQICYEALENNGSVIIQVPNAESPFFGRIRYGDFTHEIAFTLSSLSQLLRMSGWVDIYYYPTDPGINSIKSLLRFPLWKLVEAFYRILLFAELGSGHRIVTQGIIAVARKTDRV